MKRSFTFILLLVLTVPYLVSAETVLRSGDAITIDEDQVVDGDYYVSVGPVGNTSMSGVVAGDMYAFGGSVTVNGTIEEDLTILGGISQIHASVTDDVRIVAAEVIVAEDIGGDLFVYGGTLKVLSTAHVRGDLYFFGGDAVIEGDVDGSVLGSANSVRVDGQVGGNINLEKVNHLVLGSQSSVSGNVNYTSHNLLVRAPEAVVEGDIRQHEYSPVGKKELTRDILIPIIITLFATLSLYLIFRKEIVKLVSDSQVNHAYSILVGFGVLLLLPMVSLVLMVSVLGFLVGLIILTFNLFLLVASYALISIVLGAQLSHLLTKRRVVNLNWILAGAALMQIMTLIPFVGPLVLLVVFAYAIGLLTINFYRLLQ